MSSSFLKWLVLVATILVGVIITVQVYWMRKVYNLENKVFNTNVVKSFRAVLPKWR